MLKTLFNEYIELNYDKHNLEGDAFYSKVYTHI